MPRREAALEQLADVDLAAGQRAHVEEIHVVDVDVALVVRPGVSRVDHVRLAEFARHGAAVFQHRAHGRVAVDVGVFALYVGGLGVGERDLFDGLHQAGMRVAHARALVAVGDVGLAGAGVAVFDQHLHHHVLHVLDAGRAGGVLFVEAAHDLRRQPLGDAVVGRRAFLLRHGGRGEKNGAGDAVFVEGGQTAVPLLNRLDHLKGLSFFICGRNAAPSAGVLFQAERMDSVSE